MASYKINFIANVSKKRKINREKEIRYNIMNKRILIVILILYLNIQVSTLDDNFITLKIKQGNNTFLSDKLKDHLSEIYIDDISQTNIDTYYNFPEGEHTVKLVFNSQINYCNQMFRFCSNITEIDFTNFDASNILMFSETFQNCKELKSLDLSNWDVTKVTKIDNLFNGCNSLTSLKLPNFKDSKLTSMVNVFRGCQKLTPLDLSQIDTSQVKSMDYMFSNFGDIALTSLDLSYFDTSSLVSSYNMFYNSPNLLYINLSSFNTSKLTNALGMFSQCKGLLSLDLSNFDTSQVTDMKDLFKDCRHLEYLYISSFNTSEVTNMDRMFSHCSELTSLDISHFDTSKVTDMYKMFCDCFSLLEVNMSNLNISSVKNMSYMFYNTYKMKTLDISGFSMEGVINLTYMFRNNSALEYINLNHSNPKSDVLIEGIFQGTSKNLVICTQSEVISQKLTSTSDCAVVSCSEDWRAAQKKLDSGKCYDSCSNTSNKYDYLANCFGSCPDKTYTIEYLLKCVDTCPSSTYTVDNKCEKCHSDCKTCDGPSDDTNSHCTSCISPDKYLENGNCITKNIDTTNKIVDSSTKDVAKILKSDITTDMMKDITTYVENIIIYNYIDIPFLYNATDNSKVYDIIQENLLPSFEPENDNDIISEALDDVIFQITTSKNQLKELTENSMNNYNLSILDISNCETILKEKYNFNENVTLII